MIRRCFEWSPRTILTAAAALFAVIAFADWRVEFNATLGFLYVFPMVLLGSVLGWWQLVLAASFGNHGRGTLAARTLEQSRGAFPYGSGARAGSARRGWLYLPAEPPGF